MIINKTPHPVKVGNQEFQPEGEPFRLRQVTEPAGELVLRKCIKCGKLMGVIDSATLGRCLTCSGAYCGHQEEIGDGDIISLTKTKFVGADIPPQIEDTYYIVSSLFCQAFPDRKDFLMVNETTRNEKGEIAGCKSLAINPFGRKC